MVLHEERTANRTCDAGKLGAKIMRILTFTTVRDFILRNIALFLTGSLLLIFFAGLFAPGSIGSIPMIEPLNKPAMVDYPRLCGLILGVIAIICSMIGSLLFLSSFLCRHRWWVSLIFIVIATALNLVVLEVSGYTFLHCIGDLFSRLSRVSISSGLSLTPTISTLSIISPLLL